MADPSDSAAMSMTASASELDHFLSQLQELITHFYTPGPAPTNSFSPQILPTPSTLASTRSSLLPSLPSSGLGLAATTQHLLTTVLHGSNLSSLNPHYYGFVTGGATPAALAADLLVAALDQNVQVHLPGEYLATTIEDRALTMLLELFRLDPGVWGGRTFTTGATGANILGLACAREELLRRRLCGSVKEGEKGEEVPSVGELGILGACVKAGVQGIQVLGALAHSSVVKAASVVGIGRASVRDLGRKDAPWELDLELLEQALAKAREENVVSVVAVSFGEVNTGRFDTGIRRIRELADRYGAWVHVDAAFGIFARCLPDDTWADGLELADSITGDAHKLLNVPYDCGFFFTRSPAPLQRTFLNSAPYLAAPSISTSASPSQPSPLNINLENSRRFRALPVYATLSAYGAAGYRELVRRLIQHARGIAGVVERHPGFELLGGRVEEVFMVVLFRAKEEGLNRVLRERINETGEMYVSPTVWEGRPAVRCAVGNWRVCAQETGVGGWGVVESVLEEVVRRGGE